MNALRLLAVATLVLTTACALGTTGGALPVANRPGGATAVLETSSGRITGELLAVQDDGVVIGGRTIMFAPFSALRRFSIDDMSGDYTLRPLEIPNADKLARLRSVSHFPQGMTPAFRKQLLEHAAQPEIVVIQ
jgi:hypothetical protein